MIPQGGYNQGLFVLTYFGTLWTFAPEAVCLNLQYALPLRVKTSAKKILTVSQCFLLQRFTFT